MMMDAELKQGIAQCEDAIAALRRAQMLLRLALDSPQGEAHAIVASSEALNAVTGLVQFFTGLGRTIEQNRATVAAALVKGVN